MKSFEHFKEDLASGRPIKKPVSSNLLKKRAAENKKALDTGFMKMPGYVKKKFNETRHDNWPRPYTKAERDEFLAKKKKANKEIADKNLKQAKGYNPASLSTRLREGVIGDVKKTIDKEVKKFQASDTAKQIRKKKTTYGVVAKEAFPDLNEISDHLKTRYIHKSIRDIDTKERASQLADKQGAPASVGKSLSKSTGKRRKGLARARSKLDAPLKEGKKPVVHFKGEDKLKTLKIKLNPKKKIGVKVTDIGPGGKEVVRKNTMKEEQIRIVEALASRYFARDPESNSFNRTKRKETTVRVGQKRDKKTGKMVDVMGKTSAPQGLPQKKR